MQGSLQKKTVDTHVLGGFHRFSLPRFEILRFKTIHIKSMTQVT